MKTPRLMVMAGGTGGHVFPALAVARRLQESGTEITWLGTKRGLESKVIPDHDIDIEWVSIEGLRGKSALSLAWAPFRLIRAMWQSAIAIRRVQPDCILGMGGFVSGPGGLVAWMMRRPLIVHEQNAVAGLTNKYLAKIATHVLAGFPKVEGLPSVARWVGNPVRETIQPINSNVSETLNILVVGGSQGAHSFNTKLPQVFADIDLARIDATSLTIWHQSGRQRADEVAGLYKANSVDAKVSEFINDMAAAYAWADLIVCRSGAMTVAECCAAAKPALLVPYPFSAGDHQEKNALTLVKVDAGKMILNHQLDQPEFGDALALMLSDRAVLRQMGQQAYSLHKPNALQDVAAVCQEYLSA